MPVVDVHVPLSAVSVELTLGVPMIEGSTVLAGAFAATTTALAAERAVPLPAELVAVTRTRSLEFRSALVTVYDVPVAPVSVQVSIAAASQRSQARV